MSAERSTEVARIRQNNISGKTREMYSRAKKKMIAWFRSRDEDIYKALLNHDGTFELNKLDSTMFHAYLVSIRGRNGTRPGIQPYNIMRSSLRHMY